MVTNNFEFLGTTEIITKCLLDSFYLDVASIVLPT
jgi:hypothetical protein